MGARAHTHTHTTHMRARAHARTHSSWPENLLRKTIAGWNTEKHSDRAETSAEAQSVTEVSII